MATSPTSTAPKVSGISLQCVTPQSCFGSLREDRVRGEEEEEKGEAGLTSCSESPSMISDTSCSLRAADMESPPLPLCPTLLGKGSHTLRH